MLRFDRFYACVGAMLVLLSCLVVTTRAARAANPFCGATAFALPWNVGADAPLVNGDSADYALWLLVDGKHDVQARVTLITRTNAYTVGIPRLPLDVEKDGGVTEPFLVRFKDAVHVRYAYVDGVGVDGKSVTDCPTFPQEVTPWHDGSAPSVVRSALTLVPKLLQPLPKLTCPKVYEGASIAKEPYTQWISQYGDRQRSAVVRVYLDSDGLPLREKLVRSSGVDGIDQTAIANSMHTIYRPASFLCSPVVSVFYFELTYDP